MALMSLESFVTALFDFELCAPERLSALLETLEPDARPDSTPAMAAFLVDRKVLTKMQAAWVNQGRGEELRLDEYQLLDELGVGGSGVVYRAEHRRMRREVALKILAQQFTQSKTALGRFQREARAAAQLKHPNIVAAYDAGEFAGRHYFVMEYVPGSNLQQLVAERGRLSFVDAVDYCLQAARGLEYAHSRHIIHRDIKPSNLRLDDHGVVRILDMGLARILRAGQTDGEPGMAKPSVLTQSGFMLGTVGYMSPEQAVNAKRVNDRADIYSLGCTLYYCLTGQQVYVRNNAFDTVLAHSDEPIPDLRALRADAPASLQKLFQAMVAKNADERPPIRAVVKKLGEIKSTLVSDHDFETGGPVPIDAIDLKSTARAVPKQMLASVAKNKKKSRVAPAAKPPSTDEDTTDLPNRQAGGPWKRPGLIAAALALAIMVALGLFLALR